MTLMADGRGSQPGTELLRCFGEPVRIPALALERVLAARLAVSSRSPIACALRISAGSASSRVAASAIRMPSKTSKSNAARGNRSIASRACSRSAFVVSGLSDQLRGGAAEPLAVARAESGAPNRQAHRGLRSELFR